MVSDSLSALGINLPAPPAPSRMPMPAQAPMSHQIAPAGGGAAQPSVPAELPPIMEPNDVFDHFYKTQGRRPTPSEVTAIRALPVLSRQLGRRPTKRELLGYLDARNENPPTQPPIFEEVR